MSPSRNRASRTSARLAARPSTRTPHGNSAVRKMCGLDVRIREAPSGTAPPRRMLGRLVEPPTDVPTQGVLLHEEHVEVSISLQHSEADRLHALLRRQRSVAGHAGVQFLRVGYARCPRLDQLLGVACSANGADHYVEEALADLRSVPSPVVPDLRSVGRHPFHPTAISHHRRSARTTHASQRGLLEPLSEQSSSVGGLSSRIPCTGGLGCSSPQRVARRPGLLGQYRTPSSYSARRPNIPGKNLTIQGPYMGHTAALQYGAGLSRETIYGPYGKGYLSKNRSKGAIQGPCKGHI